MGNWKRAHIVGTCAPEHVLALREHLSADFCDDRWGYLHNGGIAGLPNWAGEEINATGNLGERDPSAEAVVEELLKAAAVAPSLAVKVHIGADYEKDECEATVTLMNGVAAIGPAEVQALPAIDEAVMRQNFMRQFTRRQW